MVGVSVSEHRLASGHVARIATFAPRSFSVMPFMTTNAPEDEMRLALHLGRARLGMALDPVPPAHHRIVPLDRDGSLLLTARSAPREGAACAPLRLLRNVAGGLSLGELLVNACYFLFLPAEIVGPFDAYGDPVGLTLANSVVETPPQLRRACLIMTAQGPDIRRIGFADIDLTAANGQRFVAHSFGPPDMIGPGVAFALFHGSVGGATPRAAGLWDVAFVGRHAVAIAQGGGLSIPRAGCVLRCATRAEADALADAPLTYGLAGVSQAVQAGPLIVDAGVSTRHGRDIFAEEVFSDMILRPDTVTVSPHNWAADWDRTRAARLSAGITETGELFFCAVEGSSSFFRGTDSKGATLDELALLMIEHGAVSALHLDGGGSTQVFCAGGGAVLTPRDVHHAMPESPAQFDRPLPLALALS